MTKINEENKNKFPIILNIFGAPGAGKSTAAAYIFSKLKMAGMNAELVTEYAKDKLWEENPAPFKNQLYILAKQYFRITRCAEKVDVIITDSPILLNILYNKNKSILDENFDRLVCNIHNSYNNFNVYINRTVAYETVGRFQNEEESNIVGEQTVRLLEEKQIPYITITNDISEYDEIVDKISLLCSYLRIVDCACVKDCHNCVVKNICQSDAVPEKIKEYREKLVMCDDDERDELSGVKINSCPFCNLAPTIRKGKNDTYYVVCDKCREETREYKERVDAIKAWNSQTFSEIEAVDIYCDNLFSEMTEQKK